VAAAGSVHTLVSSPMIRIPHEVWLSGEPQSGADVLGPEHEAAGWRIPQSPWQYAPAELVLGVQVQRRRPGRTWPGVGVAQDPDRALGGRLLGRSSESGRGDGEVQRTRKQEVVRPQDLNTSGQQGLALRGQGPAAEQERRVFISVGDQVARELIPVLLDDAEFSGYQRACLLGQRSGLARSRLGWTWPGSLGGGGCCTSPPSQRWRTRRRRWSCRGRRGRPWCGLPG
jgi:hypothetical protein